MLLEIDDRGRTETEFAHDIYSIYMPQASGLARPNGPIWDIT